MLRCKGLSKTKLVDFSQLSIENCLNFNIYFLWFQQTKQAMIQALVKQNSNARTRIEKQKHEVSHQSSSIPKRHQLQSFRHQVARRASTRYLYSDAPYRAGNILQLQVRLWSSLKYSSSRWIWDVRCSSFRKRILVCHGAGFRLIFSQSHSPSRVAANPNEPVIIDRLQSPL